MHTRSYRHLTAEERETLSLGLAHGYSLRVMAWILGRAPSTHVRTRQTYGPERLQAELREDGFPVGIGRIKRLRKKLGLRCTPVRRFTLTTDSAHRLPVAENVLAQTFVATRPNEIWMTDITYVPTAEGWLYLAGIKDLFTCEVVGHASVMVEMRIGDTSVPYNSSRWI